LLGFLGIVAIAFPLFQRPKGFLECHSISSPNNPEWDIAPLSSDEQQKLLHIFSQPFHYLASGAQAYAFESEDGKYVIKFFRMNHLIPRTIHFFRPKKFEKRKSNLQLTFSAYKLVYEKFREETGLHYIHLNKSSHLKTLLHVTDQKNKEHAIDLDQVPFIVQDKAELLQHRLHRLKAEEKFEELEVTVDRFLDLVRHRIELGLTDLDDGIENNYGFVGDRPIHLDVGKVCEGEQPGEYDRICSMLTMLVPRN
jgi:hypothetical protein